MAIQNRRGNIVNLDPQKLLPGEFGISLDNKKAHICFEPGTIKTMATEEDFQVKLDNITANTERAEAAALAAESLVVNKAGINDTTPTLTEAYSGIKTEQLFNDAKTYAGELFDGVISFKIKIVTELPISDIEAMTIYLVSKTPSTADSYDEYMYINNAWEHIGSTEIDLSGYYTKEEVDSKTGDIASELADIITQPRAQYSKTTIQAIPDITWTPISWDKKIYDTDNFVNQANNTTITINKAGLYEINFSINISNHSITGMRNLKIVKNFGSIGNSEEMFYSTDTPVGAYTRCNLYGICYLNAGETITTLAYHNGGVELLSNAESGFPKLSITRIDIVNKNQAFFNNLYIPTQINKVNDKYFIVSCYHHAIYYSNDVSKPLNEWSKIDYEFAGCHSIASDGDLYLVDNAGYNEVIVFDANLRFKQKFVGVGSRPHKTIYDAASSAFYVISSGTQEIICYKKVDGVIVKQYQKSLSFLGSGYIRSISIADGYMYFCSGIGKIFRANYLDESYTVVNTYDIPLSMYGLNDIAKIGSYYYITSTQNDIGDVVPRIIRTTNLSTLLTPATYEDLYSLLDFRSTPYYITVFDNKVWIPEIGLINSIGSFSVSDTTLSDFIYNFRDTIILSESEKRRDMYPL